MENKKRKGKDEKDDDEVEEEMKMDKFYALLRRFRDARDRRRKELEELEKSESKKRKVGAEQHSVWVPSFEREDFTNDVQFRGPPLRFPAPSTSSSPRGTDKRKNEQRLHDSLDLNLAL
ncbi:NIM1-INTERACTING 1 [Spatholobus suberectus]|nr:NIM1-INTERACTING 1 [Spatholobus suberectus]